MFAPTFFLLDEKINEMRRHLQSKNFTWFIKRGISISETIYFFILSKNEKINCWNFITNGLVFDKTTWRVISFPWTFLPISSKESSVVIEQSDLIEKITGLDFFVSFPSGLHNKPFVHTATDAYPYSIGYDWLQNLVEKLCFNNEHVEYTFSFTFKIHDKIYLNAGRYLRNYYEMDENELDGIAIYLNIERPKRKQYWKYDEIDTVSEDRFYIRDRINGERGKIDTFSKKWRCYASGISERIVNLYFTGKKEKILKNFPHLSKEINIVEKKYNEKKAYIYSTIQYFVEKGFEINSLQMTLADENFPSWLYQFIVECYRLHQNSWEEIIFETFASMSTSQVSRILNQ